MAHMTFAVKGANKWYRGYRLRFPIERDEFISAAYTGLVVAARKFDPSRGVKFTTMAFQWIDQYLGRLVMHYKRQNGWAYSPLNGGKQSGIGGMEAVLQIGQWPETNPKDSNPEPIEIAADDPSVESELMRKTDLELKRAIVLSVATTERERTILVGVLRGDTNKQIGAALGVTGSYVQQLREPLMARVHARVALLRATSG